MCRVLSTFLAHSKHFSKWQLLLLLLASLCRVQWQQAPRWPPVIFTFWHSSPRVVCPLLYWAGQTCITNKRLYNQKKWHVWLESLCPKRKCDFCLAVSWIALSGRGQLCCEYSQAAPWRRPCSEGLSLLTSDQQLARPVREPSWEQVPQPRSSFQMTAAPANTWIPVS